MTYKPNKLKSLSRLLPLFLLSAFFYGVMGFLTVKASDIHYARLPQVTIGQLTNEEFSSTHLKYPDIELARMFVALPTEPCETGQFFAGKPKVKSVFDYYYAGRVWDDLYVERTRSLLAIPKKLYESGQIFKLEMKEEYDFTYYYVKKVWPELEEDRYNEDYYAVKEGIMRSAQVILTGYEELYDGMEVFPPDLHKKE